jgi:hypothetical protein
VKITTVGELRKALEGIPDDLPLAPSLGPDIEDVIVDYDTPIRCRDKFDFFIGLPAPNGLQEVLVMVDVPDGWMRADIDCSGGADEDQDDE